ncbi:Gfo/Idh/MocA family oxidoreductase [Phytoactinopolyspora alkaliphila]|uniref:Gfo/Idh/MocA family oxidoreductase n=1 Tax=Phytoactinopolyspora alkaliphila TaxID=1783498 RepID=A0A6N9YR80_9ACTN|nr:Gfo/Idh/MocA family oxidoreductase [Phytoactinopolyspora alkaliphila]NED97338.1 Gfo/Idh/MocA family oxidoreductase [Phytoactinopolyspora alkaliphila]
MRNGTIRFGVVGVDHGHILGMTEGLEAAGAQCAGVFPGADPAQRAQFAERFPGIPEVDDPRRLYENPAVGVIATAGIAAERAGIAVEAMRAGKDVLADKPAATTPEQMASIRSTSADTGRIWAAFFGERFTSPATIKAAGLIASGAIGDVVQTIGLGPHRLRRDSRPSWFFQRDHYGGILTDIASHQVDQFLYLTGSTTAEVVSATVGNYANPEDPGLQDFGEAVLRSPRAHGYVRVDWYTPDGLSSWGDGRITILGTAGYIELRKNVDIAGRPGGNHLFLVDKNGEHHIGCADQPVTFFSDFLYDVQHRTETANPQEMYFTAMELAIAAQLKAEAVTGR